MIAGRETLTAPAAVQQMHYHVLHCIERLAHAAQGSTVWKGMTDQVAEAVVIHIDGNQATAVKQAAAQVSCRDAQSD